MDLEGYGIITGKIFNLPTAGNHSNLIATYSYLCFRGSSKGYCFPKQETIAKAIGVSRRTVNRNLKELEELGLIKRVRRRTGDGQPISTVYELPEVKKMLECDTSVTEGTSSVSQKVRHQCHTNNIKEQYKRTIYKGKKKQKKKEVHPEWEEQEKKPIEETSDEVKRELLKQLEDVRNKGAKKNG